MTKARDLANAGTALSAVSATELGYLDKVKEKKNSIPALAVELMDAATKIHILHLTITGAGSYADLTMDIQLIKSTLIRGQLDNSF